MKKLDDFTTGFLTGALIVFVVMIILQIYFPLPH